jgi:crotonobetainyl-CoA:carnitine CoA-transferase CaiB-like acyl-CoA transferase
MTSESAEDLPLSGFTVLELGEGVSAPYCGKLLADYGADVIKVEPLEGDPARRHGPFPDGPTGVGLPVRQAGLPHTEKSALFLYLNTNKKGITLDFSTTSGARLLRRLVEEVDVLVENQPPGRLEELGLSYRQLARLNPRLLMVSVKPFGEGPYGRWKATNLTSFASGGQMYLTGDPDRGPLLNGGYQAEYQAGLNAFAATLAALLGLAVMEVGQHVEVSAMECQACVLENYLPDYAYRRSGAPSRRRANVSSALTLEEALASTQMRARRYFQEVDHPVAGRRVYPGPPFRLTDGPPSTGGWGWRAGRAPLLGEHNEEVFGGLLGLERSDLVWLRAAGVV